VVKQGESMVCFQIEGGKALRTIVQAGYSDGQHVEVLKRQVPGTPPTWVDFTGKESIAVQAAGLSAGKAVQVDAAAK
jgi:hypothetical protein